MKKDGIATFVIIGFLLGGVWLFALWSHHRIDNLEKRWEVQVELNGKSIELHRKQTEVIQGLFYDPSKATRLLVDSLPFPRVVNEPPFIAKGSGSGKGIKILPLMLSKSGFWAYWTPHIKASGDTFVVLMVDSLWMTGDAPETKGVSWRGWKKWGLWFYVR